MYEYQLDLQHNQLCLKPIKEFKNCQGFETISDVVEFLVNEYETYKCPIEQAFVLSFTSLERCNGIIQVGLGDNNEVTVPLSTCFKFLLLTNADSCIFVHSHPAEYMVNPSETDFKLNNNIMIICSLLGIDLKANLIISGHNDYYNMTTYTKEVLSYDW